MLHSRLVSLLTRWQWVLILTAAPFLLFPTPARSLALLAIPILWLAAWLLTRQPLPSTPLAIPLLLMAVMLLVSEFATNNLVYSLPKIAGLVLGLGIFFALIFSVKASNGIEVGLGLFLASGLGITGLGLLGTNWFEKITFLQPLVTRLPAVIKGLPGAESGFHPNEVAGALLWVLPVLLSLLALVFTSKSRTEGKPWIWQAAGLGVFLMTVFVGGVFILTQSRTAFIALAITIIVAPWILLSHKWRWAYLIGLAVLAIVGLKVISSQPGWVQSMYGTTATDSNSILSLDTIKGRLPIWSRAIEGIQDFPLTGMGMNIFRTTINNMYPLFSIALGWIDIGHAHNEYLTSALDLGIPGMVAFLCLYLVSFWMLARLWVLSGDLSRLNPMRIRGSLLESPAAMRTLVFGLGGGLLAHALFGMADAVALGAKPGILFWMLLGLVSGLYSLYEDRLSPGLEGSSPQPFSEIQDLV